MNPLFLSYIFFDFDSKNFNFQNKGHFPDLKKLRIFSTPGFEKQIRRKVIKHRAQVRVNLEFLIIFDETS